MLLLLLLLLLLLFQPPLPLLPPLLLLLLLLLLLPLLQQEKRRALVLGLGPALARGLRLSRSYLALAPAALELLVLGPQRDGVAAGADTLRHAHAQ